MSDPNDLNKLVNASGFAFQLGVEHAVTHGRDHSWRVVSREHPWASETTNGFIDLVLEAAPATGVVECKRTRDAVWVFLVPDGEETKRNVTRVLWSVGTNKGSLTDTGDAEQWPTTYVSSFCAVRGSGENDRPLLERICSSLLMSVDALALQEINIARRASSAWTSVFLPMIVTTAELYVCRMAADAVDLANGTIDKSSFESVPFIRFHKSFPASLLSNDSSTNLEESAVSSERTVWVINAAHIQQFLKELRPLPHRGKDPWTAALTALNGTA
jgi:hypothetical protein